MRRTQALLLLAALGAAVGAGCNGDDPPPSTNGVEPPPPAPTAPLREYEFQTRFSRTWNNTVYVAIGAAIDPAEAFAGRVLGELGHFKMNGRPGDRWMVRTEPALTQAERFLLWHVEVAGEFGEESFIPLDGPRRAKVHVAAPSSDLPDQLVVYHEASGACGSAIRDERRGLFLSVWDRDTTRSYRHVAPPRPWRCGDFAPGECVIAARTERRQWVAMRADLSPGATVTIDADNAPKGGGKVVCEEADALLVLTGTLPIPAPRMTADMAYRATWKGVPPGNHVVRYPDGHEVPVTVEDGGEIKLPKR